MDAERLRRVLERIDQLNRGDPNTEVVEGVTVPRELAYAQRLTAWVRRLEPSASEALQIAARGQHVQRWTIPRERYERNRRGYLRWREILKTFHANTVTALMRQEGYAEDVIERVRAIILKKSLQTDPDAQTIEDALCLVFLEAQFDELRRKTPEDKMREVVQKTWRKMSQRGRAAALALPLDEASRSFLLKAVALSP